MRPGAGSGGPPGSGAWPGAGGVPGAGVPLRAAAVVLAAGTSSRLGQPKQLLPLAGEPLVRRTVARVAAAPVDPVVVVTGAAHREVAAAVADLPRVQVVFNPDYAAGMATSLVAGVRALPAAVEAAVVCLGDQPLVGPEIIGRLLAALAETGKGIAVPLYGGRRGNPVAFARRLFPALLQVNGDAGGRAVVVAHPEEVVAVPMAGPPADLDVDTWEDYERLRQMVEGPPG